MTLLDEAQALSSNAGARCTVRVLLEHMSTDEQKELVEALASPVQATALHRALTKRGHKIAADSIQRHRRRDCQCL